MSYDNLVPYSFLKDGIHYFQRRVPRDVQQHCDTQKIAYLLRTRSASGAASRARRAADLLDEYWYHLGVKDAALVGTHRLRMASTSAAVQLTKRVRETVKLSEAVGIYVRLMGKGRPDTFKRAAERSCGYVVDICGDKDLQAYSKADANRFRDSLIGRGLSGSSITRIFGAVRSVVNFVASEMGVTRANTFGNVYFDRQAGVKDRVPLPDDVLRKVLAECRRIDDHLRWLVALVSDTGMRLAAAVGLLRDPRGRVRAIAEVGRGGFDPLARVFADHGRGGAIEDDRHGRARDTGCAGHVVAGRSARDLWQYAQRWFHHEPARRCLCRGALSG